MSRRSTRLAAKSSVCYTEGAPSREEETEYVDAIVPLFVHMEACPCMSVERVLAFGAVIDAVMAEDGRRMIAYFPNLRRQIWASLYQWQMDSRADRVMLYEILAMKKRYIAFLRRALQESCYRI